MCRHERKLELADFRNKIGHKMASVVARDEHCRLAADR
jgi:hypothetical protein